MNFFRRYAFLILLVITIFISFDFLTQNKPTEARFYGFEKAIATISKPIGWGFQKFFSAIQNTSREYFELVDIKDKYIKLQQENSKLQAQLYIYKNVVLENQTLKKILNFKETSKFDFVIGKIIGYDPSFIFRSVKINLGQKDGIQPGMGAISSEGVVGLVIRVQSKTCDLLLITDPNSNIDSMIVRNQSRGILQGKLSNIMRFKYFDHNTTIWAGDKIVTTGLTGSFPANIPIGVVTNVQKNQDDLSQIVEVEPVVNVVNLTEVLILKNLDPTMEIMEGIAGSDWIEHLMNIGSGKSNANEQTK